MRRTCAAPAPHLRRGGSERAAAPKTPQDALRWIFSSSDTHHPWEEFSQRRACVAVVPSPSRSPRRPKTPSDAIITPGRNFPSAYPKTTSSILAINFPPDQPTRLNLDMARRNARSD